MSDFEEFINTIGREDLEEVKKLFKKEFINKREERGWSALHWASINQKDKIMKYLLSEGCDIEDETNDFGERCIHLAAGRGKVEVVKTLIEEGCDLESCDYRGNSVMDVVLAWGSYECAEIIKKSFKEDLELLKNEHLSTIMDPQNGKTRLDKLLSRNKSKIIKAIKSKPVNDEEIKEWRTLLLKGVNPQSYKLLHECMFARCLYQKYEDGVYDLCKADIVNKDSIFMEHTALETAVECGVAAYSIKNILWKLEKEDESWRRAEVIAESKDNERTLELILIRRKFLNDKEKEGCSRLEIAVLDNDADMVEFIMTNGSGNEDEDDRKGGRALSLSYSLGHMKCVKSLHNFKVNVNILDKLKQTPLHMAIFNRREEHSEYLVNNFIKIEDEDFMNFTVLERSVMNDCKDICERLVRKGGRCDRYVKIESKWLCEDPDLRMILYNSPHLPLTISETIFTLCFKVNKTVYPALLDKIDHRTIDLTDGDGNTLLHLCAVSLNIQLCSLLLLKSTNVNQKNKKQRTPLLELLIQNNHENDIRDGMIETVQVLIDGGASVNMKYSDECNIFMIATKCNNEKLLLTLIRNKETLEDIDESYFISWLNNKYYTFIKEVIALINKSSRQLWITKDMIEISLKEDDLDLIKCLYHNACCNVQIDVIEEVLYKAAIIGDINFFKEMIIYEISPTTTLNEGESLLSLLIKERKKEFIGQIISSRHSVLLLEKSNREKKLPLHVCIESEYWDVINRLINDMISVNSEDNDGNTPLSLLLTKMSETEDDELSISLMGYVKNLILKSADIYKVNKRNKTVITNCTKSRLKLQVVSFFRHHERPPKVPELNLFPLSLQNNQMQQGAAAVIPICCICEDEPRNCALNCGHMFCMSCAEREVNCFVCRRPITERIMLYQ